MSGLQVCAFVLYLGLSGLVFVHYQEYIFEVEKALES